ncbi:MAG: hypothetical protein HYX40_00750 [Sphingobacteriales bacterium]|nr:hypothetical protein [Sphingobacteriales bacterium]
MNNRRDFLVKGSLAATAMFVLKPMETFAAEVPGFDLFGHTDNKLVFLHTNQLNAYGDYQVVQKIKTIKNENTNSILLKACSNNVDDKDLLHYDATIADSTAATINGDYKILQKGNIKTGIISALPGENNVIEKVNCFAAYLKKQKKCDIVVCLSQLGYKNNTAADDITLAEQSTHIDIIIGGHAENYHALPVIALNNQQAEVIIHAAGDNSFGYGKIDMDFDAKGRKKQVSFAAC